MTLVTKKNLTVKPAKKGDLRYNALFVQDW